MAIIMSKGCIEAIYGLMGWKGLTVAQRQRKIIIIIKVEKEAEFNADSLLPVGCRVGCYPVDVGFGGHSRSSNGGPRRKNECACT